MQPRFHSGLLHVQVKSDVLAYCKLDSELGCFQLPQPDVLAGYMVIICTCAAAGEKLLAPVQQPVRLALPQGSVPFPQHLHECSL